MNTATASQRTTTVQRPVVVRRPRTDFTASFQKIMPYVVVVLLSMIAYYALQPAPIVPQQAQEVINDLSNKAGDAYSSAKDWGEDKFVDMQDKLGELKEKGEAVFQNVDLEELKEQAQDTIHAAQDKVQDTVEAAKDKATDMYEDAKDKASDLYETAKDKASDIYEDAKERVEAVQESVSDAFSGESFESRFPYANRDEFTHWFPDPALTGKVRDFFHKMNRGEIPDDYIRDSFSIKQDMWRLDTKERVDLILQQIHFMDLRRVDHIVSQFL